MQIGSNNPHYTQQSTPIPIENQQRHQQHSPHHQSYPNNQVTEKMMSYRTNTASPANLSSSHGNIPKV